MKTIKCKCGYKFQVHDNSKAKFCFECSKKRAFRVVDDLKPLDAAFKILDQMFNDKKK